MLPRLAARVGVVASDGAGGGSDGGDGDSERRSWKIPLNCHSL